MNDIRKQIATEQTRLSLLSALRDKHAAFQVVSLDLDGFAVGFVMPNYDGLIDECCRRILELRLSLNPEEGYYGICTLEKTRTEDSYYIT